MSGMETLPIRPYARLLTMLGEQLIKHDRIALVELVKNCYDADATRVVVAFDGFGEDLSVGDESTIALTDNGEGMTNAVVRSAWLNPATSSKVKRKKKNPKTQHGRVIQGEKGIGRFAVFKLGARLQMITRSADEDFESVVEYDIRFLDAAEPDADSYSADDTYLDELQVRISQRDPLVFDGEQSLGLRSEHGTRLVITSLRNDWSWSLLERCHQELLRLQPLSGLLTGRAGDDPLGFDVGFLVDGEKPRTLEDQDSLISSLNERAVLRVVGSYAAASGTFTLHVNDVEEQLNVNSSTVRGLRLFRQYFSGASEDVELTCGDFDYEFSIFDLRSGAGVAHRLDPDQRALVKEHRIYLYRDGLRVLPYGDADDDWLQLDVIRGTQAASRILSNDQTIGFVYITQAANPHLRDKTNREGLIDSGRAYGDFRLALQLLVTHLRRTHFARYLTSTERRESAAARAQQDAVTSDLTQLKEALAAEPQLSRVLARVERGYRTERQFLTERATRTEDLAGVGLSVEAASHDIIATAGQALRNLRLLHEEIGYELGQRSALYVRAGEVVDALSFISSRLQDVQGLFVSTRQGVQSLNVVQYARKIEAIYGRLLKRRSIRVIYAGDERLEVRTAEATLLQVFLNLMDNAAYWLDASRVAEPAIEVFVDKTAGVLLFSDNGPGVPEADAPYIFDAFYSGKGDAGRGLGLYIAREVAGRSGFTLELEAAGESRLGGATFRLSFKREA